MSDVEKARTSQTQHVQHYNNETNVAPRPVRKIANPGALYVPPILHAVLRLPILSGLFSFASTTFILSLYNVNARNIHTPNVVVGMACFAGGLAQFMAGMWEFPRGNTFGATGAFTFMFRASLPIMGSLPSSII
jgi:hypothetical protein